MELSGLNKALHLLHHKKISVENQASTREEIVFAVNCILGRMRGCDDEKALSFKVVTGKVVQQISSQRYEVYAVLKNLEKMFEILEAMEEGSEINQCLKKSPWDCKFFKQPIHFSQGFSKRGFYRLELANQSLPFDWDGPWYNCLNSDGFLELPAIHKRFKKLGHEAITTLLSEHLLKNVKVTEEDLNSGRFRFQFNSKFHGNVMVYVIPAINIEVRPRCLTTDTCVPLDLQNILLTANGSWGPEADDPRRSLWQVSLLAFENELFVRMDCLGGNRFLARGLLHLLCEKYIHYPVTNKIVDVVFLWNLRAHVSEEDWVQEKLAARVLEILENLRRQLRNHLVRNYFVPDYNMLAEYDGPKLDKAAERVLCLMEKMKDNPYSLQLFAT